MRPRPEGRGKGSARKPLIVRRDRAGPRALAWTAPASSASARASAFTMSTSSSPSKASGPCERVLGATHHKSPRARSSGNLVYTITGSRATGAKVLCAIRTKVGSESDRRWAVSPI
jgi:hypothetical protein